MGRTDPIRGEHDGPILHIVRHYRPEAVILILSEEIGKEEAEYQFLLHDKYLCDRTSGLWYHGWSFKEKNNFAGAFWGRGNCWITMAIPEFLAIRTPAAGR